MISALMLTAALVGGHGMGLAISPAEVSGPANSHSQFTYTDNGSTVETITVSPVELRPVTVKGAKGWSPAGLARYASVSPSHFTIDPGQKRVIKVDMKANDGKAHNVAILATADGNSTTSGGRISASVGARYIVTGPVSAPAKPGHFPLWPVGGAVLVLCAALIAGLGIVLRRKARA